MIDTHCHINDSRYNLDINNVIERAINSGVEKMICVGVDLKSSERAIEIASKYENIYATVGYHPHDSKDVEKNYLYELEEMSKHKKVVAIGETGLDYHYNISPKKIQKKVFNEQIELSKDVKIPIIMHNRNSDEDLLSIIETTNLSNGVVHCFSGDWKFAEKILSKNIKVSFTGMVTFIKNPFHEVIRNIGIHDFFLETDSPYLGPVPNRGKRNEPTRIKLVAEKIAEIKEISIDEVIKNTTNNALNFFTKIN